MIHRKAAQNGRLFEFVIDNFYVLVIIITIVAKYIDKLIKYIKNKKQDKNDRA